MYVIAATWYDDFNMPFLTEIFKGSLHVQEIFSHYKKQKSLYNRTIIGSYDDTLVFSDGTRVILQLHQVKEGAGYSEYETDGVVDAEAERKGITDGKLN